MPEPELPAVEAAMKPCKHGRSAGVSDQSRDTVPDYGGSRASNTMPTAAHQQACADVVREVARRTFDAAK